MTRKSTHSNAHQSDMRTSDDRITAAQSARDTGQAWRRSVNVRAFNAEAMLEVACYAAFGALLMKIAIDGGYLRYVTPRLRPLLFALAVLTMAWAALCGRNVMSASYRAHPLRCLIIMVPALMIAFPVQQGATDLLAPSTTSANLTKSIVTVSENALTTAGASGQGAQALIGGTQPSDDDIPGIDREARTIDITDDTYYRWVTAINADPHKYDGYTVRTMGFVMPNAQTKDADGAEISGTGTGAASADTNTDGTNTDGTGENAVTNDANAGTGAGSATSSGSAAGAPADVAAESLAGTVAGGNAGGSSDATASAADSASGTASNGFGLARVAMWCCPADAYAMGFEVSGTNATAHTYGQGDWLKVIGTLKAGANGGVTLEPTSIERTQAPKNEYVYAY